MIRRFFRDARIPAASFAAEDAKAFAAFLQEKAGFAQADVKLLSGDSATLASAREALRALSAGAGHADDLLVFYYSGRGVSQKGASNPRLFLAMHDSNPSNLTLSALFVPDLAESLSKSPGRVRVILDASFSGNGISRSSGEPMAGAQDVLKQAFGGRDKWASLFATGDGGSALALDEVSHGLFTHFLLKGLAGEADSDGAAGVAVAELSTYVSRNVAETADIMGETQSPSTEASDKAAKFIP